jgi:hypothetical protein
MHSECQSRNTNGFLRQLKKFPFLPVDKRHINVQSVISKKEVALTFITDFRNCIYLG